jgi:hypothetical protein
MGICPPGLEKRRAATRFHRRSRLRIPPGAIFAHGDIEANERRVYLAFVMWQFVILECRPRHAGTLIAGS